MGRLMADSCRKGYHIAGAGAASETPTARGGPILAALGSRGSPPRTPRGAGSAAAYPETAPMGLDGRPRQGACETAVACGTRAPAPYSLVHPPSAPSR